MSKELKVCFCGCGGMTKARFVPGHDSKFHSRAKLAMRVSEDTDEIAAAIDAMSESLPHEEARAELVDFVEKQWPKEEARRAKEAAAKVVREKKAADKAAKLAAARQEKLDKESLKSVVEAVLDTQESVVEVLAA